MQHLGEAVNRDSPVRGSTLTFSRHSEDHSVPNESWGEKDVQSVGRGGGAFCTGEEMHGHPPPGDREGEVDGVVHLNLPRSGPASEYKEDAPNTPAGSDMWMTESPGSFRRQVDKGKGKDDEEESEESEEIFLEISEEELDFIRTVKDCLNFVMTKGTKTENIGTVMYDLVLTMVPNPEVFVQIGKVKMADAFWNQLATVCAFIESPRQFSALMKWVGLRHVHYGADPEVFPLMNRVRVSAFEQMMETAWDPGYEDAFTYVFGVANEALKDEIESSKKHMETIKEGWEVATGQLGMEAMAAKVSANLLVESLSNGTKTNKKGSKHVALARDVVNLLQYLVETLLDVEALRGVNSHLGIPWEGIFQNFKAVPSLRKVESVVIRTMEEVVGSKWNEEKEESWKWLWNFAVQERMLRWTKKDRHLCLEAWKVVQHHLEGKLGEEEGWDGEGKDYFDDDSFHGVSARKRSVSPSPTGKRNSARVSIQTPSSIQKQGSESGLSCRSKGEEGEEDDDKEERQRAIKTSSDSRASSGFLCCKRTHNKTRGKGDTEKEKQKEKERKKSTSSTSPHADHEESKRELREKVTRKLQGGYQVSESLARKFSEPFFETMTGEIPSINFVFLKQKHLYQWTVHSLLSRLLAYIDDPSALWEDDPELALRHINFGAVPGDIPTFSQLLLLTFRRIAGDEWRPSYERVWDKFLHIVMVGFRQGIVAAQHPVSRALIRRNPSELLAALSQAPRGYRDLWACQVTIQGEKKSPIFWMIEQEHSHLARLLIRDCLGLRKNKSAVYYGRDMIWDVHKKELLSMIARKAPDLMEEILDGHIWCSDYVFGGKRRVIFYVEKLWGNPGTKNRDGTQLWPDLADTPLGVMVYLGEKATLSHWVMFYIIDKKWQFYAKRMLLSREGLFHAELFFVTAGYVWFNSVDLTLAFVFRVLGWAFAFLCSSELLYRIFRQTRQRLCVRWEGGASVPLSLGLPWNCLRLAGNVFLWVAMLGELSQGGGGGLVSGESFEEARTAPDAAYKFGCVFAAVSLIALWLSACQTLTVVPSLSEALVATQKLSAELLKYLCFIIPAILAFSGSVYVLAKGLPGFESKGDTVISVVAALLHGQSFDLTIEDLAPFLKVLFLLFKLLNDLVLFNFMISTFISTFTQNKSDVKKQHNLNRAQIVLEMESVSAPHFLDKWADQMDFRRKLPLEHERDEGPDGGSEEIVDSSKFVPPGMKQRGRASRVERYNCEQGDLVPWSPDDLELEGMSVKEPLQEGGGAPGGLEKVIDGMKDTRREIMGIRGSVKKVGKLVSHLKQGGGNETIISNSTARSGASGKSPHHTQNKRGSVQFVFPDS